MIKNVGQHTTSLLKQHPWILNIPGKNGKQSPKNITSHFSKFGEYLYVRGEIEYCSDLTPKVTSAFIKALQVYDFLCDRESQEKAQWLKCYKIAIDIDYDDINKIKQHNIEMKLKMQQLKKYVY